MNVVRYAPYTGVRETSGAELIQKNKSISFFLREKLANKKVLFQTYFYLISYTPRIIVKLLVYLIFFWGGKVIA